MRHTPEVPTVATYYYPGWDRSPSRTIRGHSGGTEWDLLFDEAALREYPDVRRPLAGAVEPSIETLEQECRTAKGAGIDAFIWCWYWDHSRLLLNDTLEMFLRCRLPAGFRYALMWVNKRPHYHLPLASQHHRTLVTRMIKTDELDFRQMIEHLADRHWSRPEYVLTNGRPLLLLFHADFLVDDLGAQRLRRLLASGDTIAEHAGFDGIEYVAIAHRLAPIETDEVRRTGRGGAVVPLRSVGFRAISNYVFLPDWTGPRVQDYDSLIDRRAAEWPMLARLHALPLWPSVSPGWDGRPRGQPGRCSQGYPWTPRIVGETPAGFSRALNLWRQFAGECGRVPLLPIASWNEWSEGHAIGPCDRHGDGMLNALRTFKASLLDEVGTTGPS